MKDIAVTSGQANVLIKRHILTQAYAGALPARQAEFMSKAACADA